MTAIEAIETSRDRGLASIPITLSTNAAAAALGLQPRTLLKWSCTGKGAIAPAKVGGRLRWPLDQVRAVLNGGEALPTT